MYPIRVFYSVVRCDNGAEPFVKSSQRPLHATPVANLDIFEKVQIRY